MKKKKKTKEELDRIKEDYLNSIPESEKNPNAKEDFEALMAKAFKPAKKDEKK
jgi:hypothetical protein